MKIAIIGGGSFGTAIAQVLATNNDMTLLMRNKELVNTINSSKVNTAYFPNILLDDNISASTDYKKSGEMDIVIFCVPSKYVISEYKKIKPYISKKTVLINTAKGFATKRQTILKTIKKEHKNSFSILGPTFANNLIKNEYSAFTIASDREEHFDLAKTIFRNTNVIIDHSKEYELIEMASILKNIFAIANGLYDSLDDGVNTKYAFLTQSYKELIIILEAMFGEISDNYTKNAVFGDLLLTSLNDQSRNKTLGQLIGRGFYTVNKKSGVILEGVRSAKKIHAITNQYRLNTPIIAFVNDILKGENVNKAHNRCLQEIKDIGYL